MSIFPRIPAGSQSALTSGLGAGRIFKDWIFPHPLRGTFSPHTNDEWRQVVRAIEDSILVYESISENISFNLAGPIRRRAISLLDGPRQEWVLDSGVGPGVSTRLLVSQGYQKIVGLDPSRKLLSHAKRVLGNEFYPVVGIAENLPFKDESIQGTLTCFALRDVRDLSKSLTEFSRVMRRGSRLCIVDIGKPHGAIQRALITLYVQHAMPRLARLLVHNRIQTNPFRMIIPTFNRLVTNEELISRVTEVIGPSLVKTFMLGGLILVSAVRTKPSFSDYPRSERESSPRENRPISAPSPLSQPGLLDKQTGRCLGYWKLL